MFNRCYTRKNIHKDHARVQDQDTTGLPLICQCDRGSDSDLLMNVENPGESPHLVNIPQVFFFQSLMSAKFLHPQSKFGTA